MTDCKICNLATGKEKGDVAFVDEDVIVLMSPTPKAAGHVLIMGKEHVASADKLSSKTFEKLFNLASSTATILFDSLGAQGTNIILQEGTHASNPFHHVCFHVLPRKENDGLNFKWDPKKKEESEMKQLMDTIKEETFFIGKKKDTPDDKKEAHTSKPARSHAPIHHTPVSHTKPVDSHGTHGESHNEHDHVRKQLRRLP